MKTLNEVCQFILDNDPKHLSITGRDALNARLKKDPTPGSVHVKFGFGSPSITLVLTDLEGKVDIEVIWSAGQADVELTFGFLKILEVVSRLAAYIKDHLES